MQLHRSTWQKDIVWRRESVDLACMTMRTDTDSCALITLLFGRTQYRLGAVVLTLNATAYSDVFFWNRLFSKVLFASTVERQGSPNGERCRSSGFCPSSTSSGPQDDTQTNAARSNCAHAGLTVKAEFLGRQHLQVALLRSQWLVGRPRKQHRGGS